VSHEDRAELRRLTERAAKTEAAYTWCDEWDANYHVVSDYLHAVPPSVVLELLDEIERLTCGLASWRERHEEALRPRGPTHKQERVE